MRVDAILFRFGGPTGIDVPFEGYSESVSMQAVVRGCRHMGRLMLGDGSVVAVFVIRDRDLCSTASSIARSRQQQR